MAKAINIIIVLFCLFAGRIVFAQDAAFKDAEALILKGSYARAAKQCKQILATYSSATAKAKAHYLLGLCQLKQDNYKQARENFRIILRRFPHSKVNSRAALGVGDSYFLAQDYKQARKAYEQFLQNFPRSELASIAHMYLEQIKQTSPQGSSYFSVQLGCFANRQNAQRLRDKLINAGYRAYILNWATEKLYRVRIGKFDNRLQAELLEQRLKSKGYATKVCP